MTLSTLPPQHTGVGSPPDGGGGLGGHRGNRPEGGGRRGGGESVGARRECEAVGRRRAAAVGLRVGAGTPALRTRRWYRTRDGAVVLMATSLAPQGRYVFTSVLRRQS